MRKRIVIAESKTSLREMLCLVLTAKGDYDVVGEARTGLEAVELCRSHRPHLVVLDLILPELSGAEVIRRVREKVLDTRALVFADCGCVRMISDAMRAKPHGFVERSESLQTLLEAMAAVVAGRIYYSAFPSRMVPTMTDGHAALLSPREREIAQMTAEGRRSKEIADRLNLSAKTVENHRSHIMEKLQVHSVVDLTRYAVANGWVSAE